MKITKTTTRTFDIQFYPKEIERTFGSFMALRKNNRLGVGKFEHCFCCEHKFSDDDKMVFITVHGVGNRFACVNCFEKGVGSDE